MCKYVLGGKKPEQNESKTQFDIRIDRQEYIVLYGAEVRIVCRKHEDKSSGHEMYF